MVTFLSLVTETAAVSLILGRTHMLCTFINDMKEKNTNPHKVESETVQSMTKVQYWFRCFILVKNKYLALVFLF